MCASVGVQVCMSKYMDKILYLLFIHFNSAFIYVIIELVLPAFQIVVLSYATTIHISMQRIHIDAMNKDERHSS